MTDRLTGLTWLQRADCFDKRKWTDALALASHLASGTCGLTDGSVAGTWRLPNIRELQSLVDYSQVFAALPPDHLFEGVQWDDYWSSTTDASFLTRAWYVDFGSGVSLPLPKEGETGWVWPVRGGP